MRHNKPRHRLSRPADQRKALLRALSTELIRHEELITTLAKAKACAPHVEKLITLGKHGYIENRKDLQAKAKAGDKQALQTLADSAHKIRQGRASLYDRDVTLKLFNEVAAKYKERSGGYTRIIKAGYRRGDNCPMAIIQLV